MMEIDNDNIALAPVVTYPKAYIDKLVQEGDKAYAEMKAGKRPMFKSADAMAEYLETSVAEG